MLLSLPRAVAQWLFLAVCNLVLFVLGLVVVAVALPFRVPGVSVSDGRPIVNLPRWAWLFGNDYDGVHGDKRGWWAANTPFGWAADSFGAMYTWTALRNPVNNMLKDSPGMGDWQFVVAKHGLRRWYGYYWVHQWSDTRAFVVRMGYKITKADQGGTELIGMTTKIDLFKSI